MAKDKMSEAIKSEINKQRSEQGQKGIGEYNEAPGGGTPVKGGGRGAMNGDFEVVNSKEEADKIRKEDPDAVIRYNQPRNDDGTFGHNSANGKPLSTKYSRGKKAPAFLNNVDLTFIKKGSTFQYKNEVGKLERVISSIDMTADELKAACTVYFKTEGGFLGVIGTAVTKKGSPNKVEKTGVTGKTGEKDTSEFAQSTQGALDAAAKKKDQAVLDKVMEGLGLRERAGAGAGAGDDNDNNDDIPPVEEEDNNEDKPNDDIPPTNDENDEEKIDENEIAQIKNADKQTQANWVRKNAAKFKKASEETGLKIGQIFHLIVTGQVKSWNTSTWGK